MDKQLSDTQLAKKLNESAYMGGQMTEYGVWYSDNSRPGCMCYPLGARNWTAKNVREYREQYQEMNG